MFLRGLQEGGVPIKFSSWHTYGFTSALSSNVNLQIQERSRSVKSVFAVQKRSTPDFVNDSGATFLDTSVDGASSLQMYQYRIGGRYFPAAPVECSLNGGSVNNGGAEAYVELQKALNIVGDYRLSSNANPSTWAVQPDSGGVLPEFDYTLGMVGYDLGRPVYQLGFEKTTGSVDVVNGSCGGAGSSCFAMATNLETSNGVEISGLNAEEQSDIALLARWSKPQVCGVTNAATDILVFVYYDAMIVLKENNVMELIQ